MRIRRRYLTASLVAVLVGTGIAVWNLPLRNQVLPEIPVASLLLDEPPSADDRWDEVRTHDPGAPSMRGLEERKTRTWLMDGDSVGDLETVHRFTSPTWAWLNYRDGSPDDQHAEFFDEIRRVDPDLDTHADEARFHCGVRSDPPKCSDWWGWLRYGQYIVEIQLRPDTGKPWPTVEDLEHAVKLADERVQRKL